MYRCCFWQWWHWFCFNDHHDNDPAAAVAVFCRTSGHSKGGLGGSKNITCLRVNNNHLERLWHEGIPSTRFFVIPCLIVIQLKLWVRIPLVKRVPRTLKYLLGGGFNFLFFMFTPNLVADSYFDSYYFKGVEWNHQPVWLFFIWGWHMRLSRKGLTVKTHLSRGSSFGRGMSEWRLYSAVESFRWRAQDWGFGFFCANGCPVGS